MANDVNINANIQDGTPITSSIVESSPITANIIELAPITANVATGAPGADGAPGAPGAPGVGVPTGGTANQALTKVDGTNYNTQWETIDKTFVGLSNVDNTSDATKNSAVATLTNKTISGASNTLSNIPESAVTNLTTDLAGKQGTITLTTTGTSGAATLVSNTLNIPQYSGGGSGDVVGPVSSIDNIIPRFDGTSGKLIQGSALSMTDAGALDITGASGTLRINANSDGGEYNISVDTTGTLAVFGSAGQTLHMNLLDGDLKTNSTVRLSNSGVLQNTDLTSGTNTFPTFNQNTTGSAAKWTTARNLAGNSVDGSTNVAFANKFIVQGTTDTGLSGAQFLGALGTGLVKNTATTGVLSIATAGTDYTTPTGSESLTNKTISGASNTISNIGNGSLTNSSVTIGSTAVSLGATAATVAGLTLTTPTIASFTNATHDHTNAAGGGQLTPSTALAATGTPSSSTYLRGDGTWATPAGNSGVDFYPTAAGILI